MTSINKTQSNISNNITDNTMINTKNNTKNNTISQMTNVGSGSWCVIGSPTFHNTYWQPNQNLVCENDYMIKSCTNNLTGTELYKCELQNQQ